jgi:protein-glutamine gamma-glutamyltransferase
MSFETTFRLFSYSAVFCGFVALWITGTFGFEGTLLFPAVMILAWLLEGSRWQISERMGTFFIVAAIPVYYLLWRYRFFEFVNAETALPGLLARLILSLTAIKLLQHKSDRDWIFLYVMAFFQVLLAAGMSISALYLVAFVAFILVMVCSVILLEIRKTDKAVSASNPVGSSEGEKRTGRMPLRRLPIVAVVLIAAIISLATPTFFMFPRVGGAGIGGMQPGVSTATGFSDTVELGGIGRIQQNDAVVMRVRIDDPGSLRGDIRWRGVALDTFDNRSWRRSKAALRDPIVRGDRQVVQVDYATDLESLTLQTFYLEPLDVPILFTLPRAVGVQGNFPVLFRDAHGSISFHRSNERITYKVVSDTVLPEPNALRDDMGQYSYDDLNYLQLPPEIDPRIYELALKITAGSDNRYDAAHAIEHHLQHDYGYTLEQKAGGNEPVADFLFNVREGHCEYFATAMAVMLRSLGIATRVVNGFQRGEYNETADAYIVRQREAHSWVEVYFPDEGVWVPFDPTPAAGLNLGGDSTGFAATLTSYIEALEMFWIQYFVAFDDQEQRSLFTSVRRGVSDYNERASILANDLKEIVAAWWRELRGDSGTQARLAALGIGIGVFAGLVLLALLFVWAYRRIVKWKFWRTLADRIYGRQRDSIIEFYEKMLSLLAARGFERPSHQTPLEFAYETGMPEAIRITERYNGVRFGEHRLSFEEREEIEEDLKKIERPATETIGSK